MTKVASTSIIFAVLSLLASCDPALAATSRPATSTATSPATQSEKTFSINPGSASASTPGSSGGSYITSPAPATVYVSVLNLLEHPADWLAEGDAWNFGDSLDPQVTDPTTGKPVHLNTAIQSPVAAYQYENPGNYTITLTRTLSSGQSLICTATIIVPPSKRTVFFIAPDGRDSNTGTDLNHPLQSAAAAINHLADHTEFRFKRGSVYTFQPEFPMKHRDLLLDCYGDPTQPVPVLKPIPVGNIAADDCPVFTTWLGQTFDITIRNLRIDSPWKAALTAGHYAYHAPAVTFGILRGSNITIADCQFDNLLEGPHGDPTMNGLLLLRNHQVDPLGIPSRTLWLEGKNVVAIGNVATNSVNESPLRAAATGMIGGLIAFNDIAQQLDAAHDRATAKASVTLRTLADVMIAGNRISNSEFSFDPHSDQAQDARFVARDNAVFNSMIEIKTNVRDAIFMGNFIQRDGGPCFTIDPGNGDSAEWIENLQLIDNTGQGWLANGRMMQLNSHTAAQLRGFVYDPAKNLYTHFASTRPATQSH